MPDTETTKNKREGEPEGPPSKRAKTESIPNNAKIADDDDDYDEELIMDDTAEAAGASDLYLDTVRSTIRSNKPFLTISLIDKQSCT
jgi:hypothetical protein